MFIEGTSGYKFVELDTYMYGSSYANAINDHHHAVGSIIKAHEVICPAGLWKDGKAIDLNKKMHFGEDNAECQGILALNDINNHGSIVGIGMRDGFPHAILLVSDEEK
jgi:hypothetical protein